MSLNEPVHLCMKCFSLNAVSLILSNNGNCVDCGEHQADLSEICEKETDAPAKKTQPLEKVASAPFPPLGKIPATDLAEKDEFQAKVEAELQKELESLGYGEKEDDAIQVISKETSDALGMNKKGSRVKETSKASDKAEIIKADEGVEIIEVSDDITDAEMSSMGSVDVTSEVVTNTEKVEGLVSLEQDAVKKITVPSGSEYEGSEKGDELMKEEQEKQPVFSSSFDDFVGIPTLR